MRLPFEMKTWESSFTSMFFAGSGEPPVLPPPPFPPLFSSTVILIVFESVPFSLIAVSLAV